MGEKLELFYDPETNRYVIKDGDNFLILTREEIEAMSKTLNPLIFKLKQQRSNEK